MNSFLELTRPSIWVLTALGIIVGGIVAGSAGFYPAFYYSIIAAAMISAGGNAVNDYFDWQADRVNAPHRPIPSGRVSRKEALLLFGFLGAGGLALALLVSPAFFAIAVFNFVVSTAYPWKLKRIPLVKNLTVSWLAASSFLAAGLIAGTIENISQALLLLVVTAFMATLAREIVKDVEDVQGDAAVGIKTLPIAAGQKAARVTSAAFLLIACVMLALPYYLGVFALPYLIGALPAVIVCIYSTALKPAKAQKAIKLAMYLVFLGFILGTVVRI